jgi:hypothetical protein
MLLFSIFLTIGSLSPPSFPSENPTVLILSKNQPDFTDVAIGIKEKLAGYLDTKIINLEKGTNYTNFVDIINKVKPNYTILMDNMALNYANKFNKEAKIDKNKLTAISIMALNISNYISSGNKFIAGIEYEAPMYTLISEYRYITNKKVNKILTFYRGSQFINAINDARSQLKLEGIELTAINVETTGKGTKEIRAFLNKNIKKILLNKNNYDALWLPLDSVLLSNRLFNSIWYKNINKYKVSVLTQEPKLANPKLNFSTFSVGSSLKDLKGQVAQLVFSLSTKETTIKEIGIEKVFSTKKALNLKKAMNLDILNAKYKERISKEDILN